VSEAILRQTIQFAIPQTALVLRHGLRFLRCISPRGGTHAADTPVRRQRPALVVLAHCRARRIHWILRQQALLSSATKVESRELSRPLTLVAHFEHFHHGHVAQLFMSSHIHQPLNKIARRGLLRAAGNSSALTQARIMAFIKTLSLLSVLA
jgi:hypothetical protein